MSAAGSAVAASGPKRILPFAALSVYFLVCLWFGYEISEARHIAVSHIATAALAVVAMVAAMARGKLAMRLPWGTRRDRWILGLTSAYILVRLVQSAGNEFFFGQAFKIFLVVAGVVCYKALDRKGATIRFAALFLPSALALMIVVGLVIWILSGQLGVERFRVGPNDYEYVSEYACHMLPLAFFAIDSLRNPVGRFLLVVVAAVDFIGLVLTGSRGPLIGALLAFLVYSAVSKKPIGKIIAMGLLFAGLLYLLGSLAYSAGSISGESRWTADESSRIDEVLSGRATHWAFEIDEVTTSKVWMVFGAGLGRFAEWIPEAGESGGYYRAANTNGLLDAYVPFGLWGLFGYLFLYRYLWRRARAVKDLSWRALTLSLLIAFIFTDQFETHWQGTRMLWYVAFIFYILTLARPALPVRVARQRRLLTQLASFFGATGTAHQRA